MDNPIIENTKIETQHNFFKNHQQISNSETKWYSFPSVFPNDRGAPVPSPAPLTRQGQVDNLFKNGLPRTRSDRKKGSSKWPSQRRVLEAKRPSHQRNPAWRNVSWLKDTPACPPWRNDPRRWCRSHAAPRRRRPSLVCVGVVVGVGGDSRRGGRGCGGRQLRGPELSSRLSGPQTLSSRGLATCCLWEIIWLHYLYCLIFTDYIIMMLLSALIFFLFLVSIMIVRSTLICYIYLLRCPRHGSVCLN